jgi:hypothetical protein
MGGAVVITTLIGVGFFAMGRNSAPQYHCDFSPSLREKARNRKLYCPDPKKLPAGVTSKLSGATYGQGAVVYSITDGSSTIAVSLQQKPDKDKLANFVVNIIPLHFDADTPVGKAQTGVSQGRSLTSLPTDSSTWILISAPQDYNIDRLTEILKTFQAD